LLTSEAFYFFEKLLPLTGCKCKANEIDDEQDVDKIFGIVIDAREWLANII
jgi:hypothetical protein